MSGALWRLAAIHPARPRVRGGLIARIIWVRRVKVAIRAALQLKEPYAIDRANKLARFFEAKGWILVILPQVVFSLDMSRLVHPGSTEWLRYQGSEVTTWIR